jgi:hypothetical protein
MTLTLKVFPMDSFSSYFPRFLSTEIPNPHHCKQSIKVSKQAELGNRWIFSMLMQSVLLTIYHKLLFSSHPDHQVHIRSLVCLFYSSCWRTHTTLWPGVDTLKWKTAWFDGSEKWVTLHLSLYVTSIFRCTDYLLSKTLVSKENFRYKTTRADIT